jgi:hypothetical protein
MIKPFMSFILYLIFCLNLQIYKSLNVAVDVQDFTDENFRNLIIKIDKYLKDKNEQNLAMGIRLAFHDCITGCNGCIDAANPDNGGLKDIATELSKMHSELKHERYYGLYLSRSDLWVLVSFRAVYIASNYPDLTESILNFKFGRKDCRQGALFDKHEDLPNALGVWDEVKSHFQRFNLTNREIVAIMGIHSFGSAAFNNSGFEGAFNYPENIFSNDYYKNLMNKTLDYVNTPVGEKYQWNSTYDRCNSIYNDPFTCKVKDQPRIFFNTDMCLYKNFTADSKGRASCTYSTCGLNPEASPYVIEFANSERRFKITFGKVLEKITRYGYPHRRSLVDPLERGFVRSKSSIQLKNK